jgi:hypothetical protein
MSRIVIAIQDDSYYVEENNDNVTIVFHNYDKATQMIKEKGLFKDADGDWYIKETTERTWLIEEEEK